MLQRQNKLLPYHIMPCRKGMCCLRVIILFLILAVSHWSFSQAVSPKFSHLTTSDGLSQNSVFAILKDYKGFMWFGTDEGLNKYDGYKFTVYKHDPENPHSISNNSLYGLLEDAAHNLWVVSAGGLDRFDRMTESFTHYNNEGHDVVFRNIFQDSKKRIWLGGTEGFCLFDADKGKFRVYKNDDKDPNSLSQNFVYRITEDNSGELWIGTRNGLNRFNPETGKFVHYFNDPANNKSIGPGYIKTVYKDSKGNIWIGTQGSGIALYNRSDNSFINFRHDDGNTNSVCHNDILSFTEDRNGQLWIGTENGGISVFDYAKNTFVCYRNNENDASSISGNSVYSLYKDDIGNIWAGTWSGGINFYPVFGGKFSLYRKIPNSSNSLSNNLVLSINNGPDNNIWIGTDGGGLDRFDPQTHIFTNFHNDKNNKSSIHNDYVLSISEYSPGVLALGFHRGGMDLFDIEKQSSTHYAVKNLSANKLTSPSVNIMYRDSQRNLWVGTSDNGGIYLFDKTTTGFTSFLPHLNNDKSIGDSSVFVMYETKAGQVCLGGDKGLDIYDRKTKESVHYRHDPKNKNSLSNNTVYSITEDPAGNLWVGTADGLNFLDTKKKTFTVYTEKQGLPNNTIWSIQLDPHGNLWISTNNGLSRFDPSTKTFRNYTISDGLQNNAFKAKASYQSPGGEMFFGGVNGFNSFYPDSIKDNDFIPPVYFTDFQVFNKPVGIGGNSPLKQSINEVKEITLSYSQSVFTIEFAALNFTQPGQNMYAYKLEGFDKDWNYVGKKRTATYTNLDPGTYIFKVKGSNNDGIWNETGTSIKITITPPFWRTWWFILLVFLLVAGSSIGFYRFRMNIIQKQKLLLEQKVKEQTIQLIHSNEEEHKARREAEHANLHLERKNKELEQFAYVASHDLQEPLRTTSSFVGLIQAQYKGKLDDKADKYFNYILEASDRMRVLIKNLLDYSRIGSKKELEQVDCKIILENVLADLQVAIQEAKADITCDPLPSVGGYPVEIKQLFQNLLINAIKFRKKDTVPKIIISAKKLKNEWEFVFKDNGIGIEAQHKEKIFNIFQRLHKRSEYEGSGIGLAHCKKIVELHGGRIWVASTPGEGAAFHFTISANNNL
jgi:ligand-binding sensor domain-containing protein/signal transduction histidine kinase